MKNKIHLKILSFGLLVAFGLQDLAWAEGASGGALSWPAARKNGPIHLSKTLASLSQSGEGRTDWKIIHVQDAHDSLEAQKKISGILETLVSEYDIRSIALEGSGGDIDPSLFKTYPDQKWAERSAGKLVEEGKLNAGEFFAITSKNPVSVYGVEERTLYRENLKAFRDLLLNKEKIDSDLKGLSKTLETLSDRIYSEKIKWIREHSLFSDTSNLSFPKKWEAFESLAREKNIDLKSYPSLSHLAGAASLENSIDFKRANQEREELFSNFKNTLKGAELEALLQKSVRFKAGEISDLEYYQFLSSLAHAAESDSAGYPNLIAYIEYLQYFDVLNLADVLKEFVDFEGKLKEAFFVSEDERILSRLERECLLVKNLLSGSATSIEFERFKNEISRARFTAIKKGFQDLTARHSVPLYEGLQFSRLENSLPKAMRFYSLAKKRDAVLLRNTLKRMRKDGQRVAALVTGGFHAEGITELLKKNELSYLVVLPSVEDPSKKRPYMTILTRRRGQYEKELAGPSSRYKVVLGTGLDTAQANPYAKIGDILQPLAEGLKGTGQNAGSRLARWMDEYEKAFRENKLRGNKALEPRNVRKALEKMIGRHEKRPEATRGARLAEAKDFIADNKINFDPRFNYRVLKLAEKNPEDWNEDEKKEYEALRKEVEEAHDWTRQDISRYPSLIGHPPTLLSLEGIVSAVERGKGPRLTSYHGGLGVLFGEWIRGIAYLGGVTTFEPDSKAPEFHIFIPDYEKGVTTSRVHSFGYPTLGARQIQRPQDHGIDFMKDPKDASKPFQIEIPLDETKELVYVRFRAVKIGALKLIMPVMDFDENHWAVQHIFEELYKGKPSSRERFEQEWVAGLAAFEFRKKMGIPLDGPVHLNETATFPYLIGLIRYYMEEGYSYEDSLKLVGSQLVFFTHTLVAAGIDHFHEDSVKMGHYIRSYFEKSSSEAVRGQAGIVARDMIHGRRSEDGKLYLPGFEESHRRNVYSPLHFVVRLAHSFDGTVVAVSQLNAIEAGKFFIQQGVITPEENAKKPVLGITNGVDHLFWMLREVREVMNWQESEPEKRTPERILDPNDPSAKRLAGLFDRTKEFEAVGGEPILKDEVLFEKLYENKKLAVEMVRGTVRQQYIRETDFLEGKIRENNVSQVELERLHIMRTRWAHWIGKDNPEEWVKSWEGRPFEEQEPFRKELREGELKNLLDPELFLGVWARRIVNYKRILFTIFGHFLPEVEAQIPSDHALKPNELDELILRLKNKGALHQFMELVLKKKAQFIFAGKAFSEDGRSSVALIHRVIELLSKEHPEFQDRVLFLEGYDETKSQYLVRGADSWINTPKRPLEASGTSGMKVAKGNIYASPNGDGWGAGGIEDKLNGRVKGVSGAQQDHPDTWPLSERENATNVSDYLSQEAAHFFEMMSEDVDRYNKAMAYFLRKEEGQHPGALEWLQQIRRWMYFTAQVYDIRGEFTGRKVPSFRPEDVPGGDERGIFSLYEEAIARTQALKKSIVKQGARLAGLYENPLLEEMNREKALYGALENTRKIVVDTRRMIPDYEKVTRLVYPASNYDSVTVASLLAIFPNVREVFVVDFFGTTAYDLKNTETKSLIDAKRAQVQKQWTENLNHVIRGFEIPAKNPVVHVVLSDYYSASEISQNRPDGITAVIDKFPGYQAGMRGAPEFRSAILRDTRSGDLVFSLKGGHHDISKWTEPPLGADLSLPYLWDWQKKWTVSRLSEEDYAPEGARLAVTGPSLEKIKSDIDKFEKGMAYLLGDPQSGLQDENWKKAAQNLRDYLGKANRALREGNNIEVWRNLSDAWAQFDKIPGEEFLSTDHAVRRHQFEELFLTWAKAVDPTYAYYLMVAFAIRELNLVEEKVDKGDFLSRSSVVRQMNALGKRLTKIQGIVMQILSIGNHHTIDPYELQTALLSVGKEIKKLEVSGKKTVRAVYANDRNKIFENSKLDDPSAPLTASFFRLIQEMKNYSETRPTGARLASESSKEIEGILAKLLETADKIRNTKSDETRVKLALEFLDSVPFKITVIVHAYIERLMGLEGVNKSEYLNALETIQSVFSKMNAEDRTRTLHEVVRAAESTRGNIIVGLLRPIRDNFSGARLANSQPMIQSLRQTYLKMQVAFQNELKADAPSADVIVVTAYDERMKKLYENHLEGLRGITYRKDIPVLVVTNPVLGGKTWSAGSGGMLTRSLRAVNDAFPSLKDKHPHLRVRKGLEDLNILVVQGGGLGERMLFSAVLGSKTLTPLPVPLGEGRQATLLDLAMMAGPSYTQELVRKGQPGLVVLAGDIISIMKPGLKDGLNLLGAPKTPGEIDRRLGVIAQNKEGQVYFVEKPSLDQIALDPHLRGKRYLLANAANSVLTHSDPAVYRRALKMFLDLEEIMGKELEKTGSLYPVDTSIDLIEPRAASSMTDALVRRTADDPKKKDFYTSVYERARKDLPDLVVPRQSPRSSYFIDFASVLDWAGVMSPESVLSQVIGRSFTSSDRSTLRKIAPSRNETRWKYVLFGLEKSIAYVGDDRLMLKAPVKINQENGMAVVYVSIKDRLEKTVEQGTLFGQPASQMLKSWGVDFKSSDLLLDVPAWPVIPEGLLGHLGAIQGLSKGRPSDFYGYLPKISIRQIQRSINMDALERPVQGARLASFKDLRIEKISQSDEQKRSNVETFRIRASFNGEDSNRLSVKIERPFFVRDWDREHQYFGEIYDTARAFLKVSYNDLNHHYTPIQHMERLRDAMTVPTTDIERLKKLYPRDPSPNPLDPSPKRLFEFASLGIASEEPESGTAHLTLSFKKRQTNQYFTAEIVRPFGLPPFKYEDLRRAIIWMLEEHDYVSEREVAKTIESAFNMPLFGARLAGGSEEWDMAVFEHAPAMFAKRYHKDNSGVWTAKFVHVSQAFLKTWPEDKRIAFLEGTEFDDFSLYEYDLAKQYYMDDINLYEMYLSGQDIRGLYPKIERHISEDGEATSVLVDKKIVTYSDKSFRIFGSFIDVTKQVEAEKKLKQSENHLNQALSAAGMVAWVWDLDRDMIHWSDGADTFFGLSKEILPRSSEDMKALTHPEDKPKVQEAIQTALRERRTYGLEFRILTKEGQIRWIQNYPGVFSREDGSLVVSGIFMDVTQRKNTDIQLLQSEKLASLGELAAVVGHEFGNSMLQILGNIRLARERYPKDEHLAAVEREAERSANIAKSLLSLSKPQQQEKTPLDLTAVAEAVTLLKEKLLKSKRIELQHFYEKDLPRVMGDNGQLMQLLLNLVINAEDAIVTRGTITIHVGRSESGREVILSVQDTGRGMDEETRTRIFDPYYTTKQKGTGLGLPVVAKIAAQHNATIIVRSEIGRGTEFSVTFPAKPEILEAPTIFDETLKVSPKPAPKFKQILFVDDEELNHDLFKLFIPELFDVAPENVFGAHSASEAVTIYRTHPDINFVLMDYTMPDINGAQAARILREEAQNPSAPRELVISFLSGYGKTEEMEKLIRAGIAQDAWYKPDITSSEGRKGIAMSIQMLAATLKSSGARLATQASASGLSASENPILVGVRSSAVGMEIQKIFSDRKDVEIVYLSPHSDPQDTLRQLDTIASSQNSSFSILIDDEDLNEKAKVEFLRQFHKLDLQARPVLRDLLSGRVEMGSLSDEQKKALVEDLSKILPSIAPKSWASAALKTLSVEEIWMNTKLELYHPSFGTSIEELPGFADKSPRAAIWSLETILKDPLILKTLEDRDRKLAGRMRIDDYLLSGTLDEATLEKRIGDIFGEQGAAAFKARFAGRFIKSSQTGDAGAVAKTLQTEKGYKPEHVLFVDLDEKRSVLRSKEDPAYKVLYLRGTYALTLDKVATQILAAGAGAKNLFMKGLQIDGEGNFIFTPILPIDFERHFKDFYQSLKQILQAA